MYPASRFCVTVSAEFHVEAIEAFIFFRLTKRLGCNCKNDSDNDTNLQLTPATLRLNVNSAARYLSST